MSDECKCLEIQSMTIQENGIIRDKVSGIILGRLSVLFKDSELVEQLESLIEEQKQTIKSLMHGVEEHVGKEGTTPVLRYIVDLETRIAKHEGKPARVSLLKSNLADAQALAESNAHEILSLSDEIELMRNYMKRHNDIGRNCRSWWDAFIIDYPSMEEGK